MRKTRMHKTLQSPARTFLEHADHFGGIPMKIKDIEIEGFGVWSGLSVDSLPDGMTVFYGPNEAARPP